MFRVTVLLVSLAAVAAADPIPSSGLERIVGGSVTTISQYPFATSLLYSPNLIVFAQHCGGSILTQRSILSAAQCFDGTLVGQWRMRVGSSFANSGGSILDAALFRIHPDYDWRTTDNDIAILRSATTIGFIPNAVQPASIAGTNYFLADNSVVWAIGWGRTSFAGSLSDQLRHVQIWTVDHAECRSRYAGLDVVITDNMLCAGWLDVGGRDACAHDDGGPLLHGGVVVGVISFGAGCGLASHPGVYTRVSRYAAWIQSNA